MASMSSQPESLRERNKSEKRARILASARSLFERQGFEATTAREICRRAGIGTGTLFLYVRDKRELLFLVFRDEARGLFRSGSKKAAAAPDLVDALMALFGEFIAFYDRNPELAAAIVGELFLRNHESEALGALTSEYLDCVQAVLAGPLARGELRGDATPLEQSRAIFAHYGFWMQEWFGGAVASRKEAEAGLHRALELQLQGLITQRERA